MILMHGSMRISVPRHPAGGEPVVVRGLQNKRKPNWRLVKVHRSYSIDETAKVTGLAKGTIRRWIKIGELPAITDQRPFIILGDDLSEYLRSKGKPVSKLALQELYCFGCRASRLPAARMADYVPLTSNTGNLRALCERCTRVMHKAVSRSSLRRLSELLDLSFPQGDQHLKDTSDPSLDDHLQQERQTHA